MVKASVKKRKAIKGSEVINRYIFFMSKFI